MPCRLTNFILVAGLALGFILHAQKENNPPTPSPLAPSPAVVGPLNDAITAIIANSLNNTICYTRLGYICDTFGGRPSGSQNLEDAISWIHTTMITVDGLDNVTLENVTVPHWVRGIESASMTTPFLRILPMLSLGGRYAGFSLGGLDRVAHPDLFAALLPQLVD